MTSTEPPSPDNETTPLPSVTSEGKIAVTNSLVETLDDGITVEPVLEVENVITKSIDSTPHEVAPRFGFLFGRLSMIRQKGRDLWYSSGRLSFPRHTKEFAIVFVGVLILVSSYFGYRYYQNVPTSFVEVYSLLPDKVSKSAPLVVTAPEGVSSAELEGHVVFEPAMKGVWLAVKDDTHAVFRPITPLAEGKYYRATLDLPEVHIVKDFLADADPAISAVFPRPNSEGDEYSPITFVFNRPMVALGTLNSTMDASQVPIDISPTTKGTWKWISTRNLQFIPESHLIRSAHYSVTMRDMVSVEGLTAKGTTTSFTTRALRFTGSIPEMLSYHEPLRIQYNQPVDLEQTRAQITLENGERGRVPVIVEYGTRSEWDAESKKNVVRRDTSLLFVYPASDKFGRAKRWNFSESYQVQIARATPSSGDIVLQDAVKGAFQIGPVISSMDATSPRSDQVRPDFFDPQGVLWVTFAEDIDIRALSIDVPGIKNIVYAEMCKEPENGEEVAVDGSCPKVPQKDKIGISFDPAQLPPGKKLTINFQKIVNIDGIALTNDVIQRDIQVYPKFQILHTSPAEGAKGASLTELVVCSNSPVEPKDRATYGTALKANGYLVYNSWYPSYLIESTTPNDPCLKGEFSTRIHYGIHPERAYTLTLSLTDPFLQSASLVRSFTSGVPEAFTLRIQNLQQAYNVTPSTRTKLTFASENMTYVDINLCKMGPVPFLALANRMPSQSVPANTFACSEKISKRIPLPEKYWVNNFFQVDLKNYFPETKGYYLVTLSHPRLVWNAGQGPKPIYEHLLVQVTDIAVGEKRVGWDTNMYDEEERKPKGLSPEKTENLYWVSRVGSLDAVSDAVVTPYRRVVKNNDYESSTLVAGTQGRTDARGIVRVTSLPDGAGTVVTSGKESAVVSLWADNLAYAGRSWDVGRTYVYTDRPIYRPGDTVHIKAIDRIGYDGSYEVMNSSPAPLLVRNSKGDIGLQTTLPVSLYGTYATDYTIPLDAPLGTYNIESLQGYASFAVEAYVASAFQLTANSAKDEYTSGETMRVNVDAQYYFGVAVDGGSVEYRVTAQDYYFDRYTDEYFHFGADWYSCYRCGYGDQYLKRGKVSLDRTGKASIDIPLDFATLFQSDAERNKSKVFVLHLTAKDKNGRSVSAQTSAIVHRARFYAGLSIGNNFAGKGQAIPLRAKTVDQAGKAVSVSELTLTAQKVEWVTMKRREVDGGFYYHSDKKLIPVRTEKIETDKTGNWAGSLQFEKEGEYEIQIAGKDNEGNPVSSLSMVYVYGPAQVEVDQTNNATLNLSVNKTEYMPGEEAQIIIKSPYPRAKALVTVERGRIFEEKVIDVIGNIHAYTVPIWSAYAPNVFVSVLLLSPDPEVKFGQVEFRVDAREHQLKVEAIPRKLSYLPGEEVTIDVKTTDFAGTPLSGEVSLAVADLSVLALVGHPKKDPMVFYYDGFPLTVSTLSNMKNILYEQDIPLGSKGGDGGTPGDLAKKKRGEFRDTAFWSGSVVTDAQGKASVTFRLPDNLTTWQVESVGVTKDTRLGAGYSQFTTKKDLMVVPLKPRFIIPGDTFSLGAKIFNQTDRAQTVSVSFESTTLELPDGKTTRTVSIGPGETSTLYVDAIAPNTFVDGNHNFILSAKNSQLEDVVEGVIPVTRNENFESTATSGFSPLDLVREYLYLPLGLDTNRGEVTLRANATLAVYFPDALNSLLHFPFGGAESIASTLRTLSIVKGGVTNGFLGDTGLLKNIVWNGETYTLDDAVRGGITQLLALQGENGGFPFYQGDRSNPYVTLSVLESLLDVRDAGYEVPKEVLVRGGRFTANALHPDVVVALPTPVSWSPMGELGIMARPESLSLPIPTPKDNLSDDEVIRIASIFARIPGLEAEFSEFRARVLKIGMDNAKLTENLSSSALARLVLLSQREDLSAIRGAVRDTLENRIEIDARGAYLAPNLRGGSGWFSETTIGNTALAITAIDAVDPKSPLIEKLLRWEIASRVPQGGWGSSYDTALVIHAFARHLALTHEQDQEFHLGVTLNERALEGFNFTKDAIRDTFTTVIPLETLNKGKNSLLSLVRTSTNAVASGFYYDVVLRYLLPVGHVAPRDEGFTVTRAFYAFDDTKHMLPLTQVKVGDVVRARISVATPKERSQVGIEAVIPAGFELVNFRLSTEDQSLVDAPSEMNAEDEGPYGRVWPTALLGGIGIIEGNIEDDYVDVERNQRAKQLELYPNFVEQKDDRLIAFVERLDPGVYVYEYYLRALTPGTFQYLPVTARELNFPEHFGRTQGEMVTVTAE